MLIFEVKRSVSRAVRFGPRAVRFFVAQMVSITNSIPAFTRSVSTLALATGLLAQNPGRLDSSFNPGSGVYAATSPVVYAAAVNPEGRIYLGGAFEAYAGLPRNNIVRLLDTGSVDPEFDPSAGPKASTARIYALALQKDGKIIIGGTFTNVGGFALNGIARLNPNGTIDPTFNSGTGVSGGTSPQVRSLAIQKDGKIVLGGVFTQVGGVARRSLARLNTNGTLDASFNPGPGANSSGNAVASLALQADGKILAGGSFRNLCGVDRYNLGRVNSDGSGDATFNPGTGVTMGSSAALVFALSVQPDDKVLVGGLFSTVAAVNRNSIARLHFDGSVDTNFDPGTGAKSGDAPANVYAIALLPDGRSVIGGSFNTVGGLNRAGVARLLANGQVDPEFIPGSGVTGGNSAYVNSVALESDGNLIVAGSFSQYDGTSRANVAGIYGNTVTIPKRPILFNPIKSGDIFRVSLETEAGRSYTLEFQSMIGGFSWTALPPVIGNGQVKTLEDPAGLSSERLYRVKAQ